MSRQVLVYVVTFYDGREASPVGPIVYTVGVASTARLGFAIAQGENGPKKLRWKRLEAEELGAWIADATGERCARCGAGGSYTVAGYLVNGVLEA